MVKLLGSKSGKIANPIEFEKRIAKCFRCKDHYYLPDMRGDLCVQCAGHDLGNGEKVVSGDIKEDAPLPLETPKEDITS
jgi:hypothetical protein